MPDDFTCQRETPLGVKGLKHETKSQHLEMDKVIPVLSQLVAPHECCSHRFLLHVPLKGTTLQACSYDQQTYEVVYNYR